MRVGILAFALLATASAATAAPANDEQARTACLGHWKSLDSDDNGALEKDVDKPRQAVELEKAGAFGLSRDDFLKRCAAGDFAAILPKTPAGTAESKDFGKGDLTPGPALTKEDAQKKLKDSGFGDVTDLKKDDQGIWRGTGVANGKKVAVAIDAQGDILAK